MERGRGRTGVLFGRAEPGDRSGFASFCIRRRRKNSRLAANCFIPARIKKYRIFVEAASPSRVASTAGGRLGLWRFADGNLRFGRGQEIAEPAHRLDDFDAELLAQPSDENLNRI